MKLFLNFFLAQLWKKKKGLVLPVGISENQIQTFLS